MEALKRLSLALFISAVILLALIMGGMRLVINNIDLFKNKNELSFNSLYEYDHSFLPKFIVHLFSKPKVLIDSIQEFRNNLLDDELLEIEEYFKPHTM